jgi:hypothetical protein
MARRYAPEEIPAQTHEEGKLQANPETQVMESIEQSLRARQTKMLVLSPELNAWFSKGLDGHPTL